MGNVTGGEEGQLLMVGCHGGDGCEEYATV